MGARRINVLLADDSLAVRTLLKKVLSSDEKIDNIYAASNGRIALEFFRDKKPDILILDMNMPEKTGLEIVTELRNSNNNTPIVLFSTSGQAPDTLKALQFKQVDFLAKDEGADNFSSNLDENVARLKMRLAPKLFQFFSFPKAVATPESNISITTAVTAAPVLPRFKSQMNPRPNAVVIASSTGGPRALEEVFKDLQGYVPSGPMFIVQHMPVGFTAQLAARLTKVSGLNFKEAVHEEVAKAGTVYIAPGGLHMELRADPDQTIKIILHQKEQRHSVRPSAEYLFETAALIFKHHLLTIVLTGMGDDGIEGARVIKANFGKIVTQTADTCAVYGMPRAIDDSRLSDGSENPENIRKILIDNFLKK